ncbi:MAG: hypothetical protein L0Z49_13765, partial [Actinobacteria bacterium]|nr:hypothetical protein [Actinomycetota bacterium]
GHDHYKGEIGDDPAPAIEIEVTPTDQQVLPSGQARWEIVIRNTGNVRLTLVALTEITRVPGRPVGPGIVPLKISDCEQAAGRSALDPGEERRFACESKPIEDRLFAPATPDPVRLTFRAMGVPPDRVRFVTDQQPVTIDVIHPAIRIDLGPDDQEVRIGETATFVVTVTNTGDVDLTEVRVDCIQLDACDRSIGSLAMGASVTYACTSGPLDREFLNQANVFGTTPIGTTVADTDDLAMVRIGGR